MEKRKAYIIVIFIVITLSLLLLLGYIYTTNRQSDLNRVTELDVFDTETLPGTGNNTDSGSMFNIKSGNSAFKNASSTDNAATVDAANITNATELLKEKWSLRMITNKPTAGHILNKHSIYFIDKSTGDMYKTPLLGKEEEKVAALISRHIEKAYFITPSSLYITHTDNTPLEHTTIDFEKKTASKPVLYDTTDAISQNSSNLYYTTINNDGLTIYDVEKNMQKLFSSPLTNFNIQAINNELILTQKPSAKISGYSYSIPLTAHNSSLQAATPVIRDVPALSVTASPSGARYIFSHVSNNGLALSLYTKKTDEVVPFTIKTLAEKCVWGSNDVDLYCAVPNKINGTLPDEWYQGKVHFADGIWHIDTDTGEATELIHNTGLDVQNISFSDKENAILFENKNDQTLWMVIKEKTNKR